MVNPVNPSQQYASELIRLLQDTRTKPGSDPYLSALALAVQSDLPVLLWGAPGIGKTATLERLAVDLGLRLETVVASVHDPTDFNGLPLLGAAPARLPDGNGSERSISAILPVRELTGPEAAPKGTEK